MSYHINGVMYVVDSEKYLYNPISNLYLRRLDGDLVEDVLAGYSAQFFWWSIEDGRISSPDGTVVVQLQPETISAPEPEPEVAPAPEPEPEVAPAPEPEPEAAPAPEPEPEVAPAPEPETEA